MGDPDRCLSRPEADCAGASKRNIQCRDRSSKWPILRKIIIHRAVDALDFGEAINQRALKGQLLHAALNSRAARSGPCIGSAASA